MSKSATASESTNAEKPVYRELVGLFHSADDLEEAISAITSAGWDRANLSILAQHSLLGREHLDGDTRNMADDPASDRGMPVSETDIRQGRILLTGMAGVVAAFIAGGATVVTGGGTLAAVIGATAAGGGAGLMVEALGLRIGSAREKFIREQLDHGGILLWVKVDTPDGERRAQKVLEDCGASNIHLHQSTVSS